jgi:hypothetical protein
MTGYSTQYIGIRSAFQGRLRVAGHQQTFQAGKTDEERPLDKEGEACVNGSSPRLMTSTSISQS